MLAQMCKNCGSFVPNPVLRNRGSWWIWVALVAMAISTLPIEYNRWAATSFGTMPFSDWLQSLGLRVSTTSVLLFPSMILFIIAGLYSLWLQYFKKKCCPRCENTELVGLDTIIGKELYAKLDPKEIPAGKICPKCKKIYDDSWSVCINDGTKLEPINKKQDVARQVNNKTDNNGACRQIEELSKLKKKGILSQKEFDDKKKELLERL